METGKLYWVWQTIKTHTSPLAERTAARYGRFIKETEHYYIFDNFRARKNTIVEITEKITTRGVKKCVNTLVTLE